MAKRKLYIYMSGSYNNSDGTSIIKGNLGDMFGFYLINWLIDTNGLSEDIEVIPINQKTPKSIIKGPVLCLVGSIINHIPNFKGVENVTFLGCGNINGDKIKSIDNINIIGVRGFLTKESLVTSKDIPVIGDPGLLLSNVFPIDKKPTKKIGYIIHSVDRDFFFNNYPDLKVNLINNYQSPEKFIKELLEYEKIVSSSLHGIIFSHSFNKEVIPIKITNKITGGDFKFNDYYTSIDSVEFGRKEIPSNLKIFDDLFLNGLKFSNEKIEMIKENQILEISNFLKKFVLN
jgi:pyruvyltransferase